MLYKYIWNFLGQEIPKHTASYTCEHTDKHQQKESGLFGLLESQLYTDDSKCPQPQSIHPEQQTVIIGLVMHQHSPHTPDKEDR